MNGHDADYWAEMYGVAPPQPGNPNVSPPKAQPSPHVPAAEEYDFIARRMKELRDEREKRVQG